jgi:NADH-quinone oxidoreductase subunit G
VQALADATGARLAWVPRRAGERGAIDAGCLPTLLPGGRQVGDTEARVDIGTAWGATVPTAPGRSLPEILSAAATGSLTALVVGGVDPADLPDPVVALSALDQVDFLVSLEIRASAVTERADVVFPVAAAAEKPGSYTDWEGRERLFRATLPGTGNLSDLRVLATLADAIGPRLGLVDAASARAELAELGQWDGARPAMPTAESAPATPAAAGDGEAVLASWHELIDAGRMLEGERHLAATARPAVARVSPETARALGLVAGGTAQVHGPIGELELPVEVEELMSDGVVWLPANSRAGGNIRVRLGAVPGDIVRVTPGPTQGGAA